MDIKNLTEVVDLGLAGASIYKQAMADHKIDFSDAPLLLQLVPVVPPALEDIDKIPAEVSDLSSEELAALTAHVVQKLGVVDAKALEIIGGSLKVGSGVIQLLKALSMPAAPPAA